MFARRTMFKVGFTAGSALLLAACTDSGADPAPSQGGGDQQAAPEQPAARITATPAADATDVPVTQPISLKVSEGTFTDVKVTNDKGEAIAGKLSEDKVSWSSSEPLGYGKTYTYAAQATGTDNKPAQFAGKFSTLSPKRQVRATVNPADDATVGVAMPISVKFASDVADRAAVQRALSVKTKSDVEGSWAWLSDRQVDYRPKQYWPANEKITVEAKLYGVHFGGGDYGRADVSSTFATGRNQVVKINTPDHVMKVYRGGAEHASYPCSNGLDSVVDRNTPNGTFIVMTKEPTARFDNARYGYTNVNKQWACRISNHGEYIHENQDNAAAIGKTNNSHGCVNLLAADAKKYFDSALIGDPVEIRGSRLKAVTTSDVMDWLLDWETWKSKSAL